MDESDEDVDPLMGPVAELMAEHHLSSIKTTNVEKPVTFPSDKLSFLDDFNLHTLIKDIFNYLLDMQWYYSLTKLSPQLDRENYLDPSRMYSSMKKLSLLFVIYTICTFSFPYIFHLLLLLDLVYLLIIHLLYPLSVNYNWFQCLKVIHQFFQIIQTHQQWLINIQGFQLIRPISSLFENQLYQFRRHLFKELQRHFLLSRQLAREHAAVNEQLICYIGLDEFGPLITNNHSKLDDLTNHYDQISLNSIWKLSHLQINECIQTIHLTRPKFFWIFSHYKRILRQSIEILNLSKRNCATMLDTVDLDKLPSKKFLSSYFLLRSNCEQLFEIQETNSYEPEQLKRIIQDLKTVIYSLEAIQYKPLPASSQSHSEQILSNDNNNNPSSSSIISSYHRFDDRIEESVDEILVCDTGKFNHDEETTGTLLELDDFDQRLLREQTNCLMKELQTALQGKKQEWTEREQRLLGNVDPSEDEEEVIPDHQPFEKLPPLPNAVSMLDELKHTFVLNRAKLNIDEDVFGEEEEEDD